MPFVAAGFPSLEATAASLPAAADAGADLIEIGFPFSDPVADGPTIQSAFTKTLARKTRVSDVFATVASARGETAAALVAMVSYSIVYRYGLDRFIADARTAGFDALLLPDLPLPEATRICHTIRESGLATVLLVAPTTPPRRRDEIAALSNGFIYYLSVAGITGERDRLPADLAANVADLKSRTHGPVCVGFGIHRAEQVAELSKVADGAIVGSAVVRRMGDHAADGPGAVAAATAAYCRELLRMTR